MRSDNKITHLLIQEHEIILQLNQLLEKINGLWNKDPKKFLEVIQFMIKFCQFYADKIHHFKEEQILFPVMIEQNPILEQGAVGEMNEQHETFREYIQDIKTAIENNDFKSTHTSFQKYLALLADHIQIENFEVFPMADDLLTPELNEQLYFKALDVDLEYQKEKEELSKQIQSYFDII